MEMLCSFIETSAFTSRVSEFLSDEDYAELQWFLLSHPEAGDVIVGGGGIRKLCWAMGGRGNRGGLRVIYYWADSRGQILMLEIYAKNEKADLSAEEVAELKRFVKGQ